MADFDLSMALTADGSGAESEIKQVAGALDNLDDENRKASESSKRLSDEMANLRRGFAGIVAAAKAQAAAQKEATNAAREAEAQTRRTRAATSQLGFQIQDITMGLSTGVSPFVIMAQQAGQTAMAVENMGGRFSGVARVIGGPFGSVVIAAIAILGQLAIKMYDGGDAADDMSSKQSKLGDFIDLTTGKIKNQISAVVALAEAQRQQTNADQARKSYETQQRDLIAAGLHASAGVSSGMGWMQAAGMAESGIGTQGGAGATEIEKQTRLYAAGTINVNQYGAALKRIGDAYPDVRKMTETLITSGAAVSKLADEQRKATIGMKILNGTATDSERAWLAATQGTTTHAKSVNSLIEAQSRYATATTAVERARAKLQLIEQQAPAITDANTKAAREYRASLDAANKELTRAEAAQKAANKAAAEGRAAARAGPLTDFNLPVSGTVTSGFGGARAARAGVGAHNHAGIDIAVPVGTNVGAAAAGTVIESGVLPGYGNVVIIDHGSGTTTRYAHLSKLLAPKGTTVTQGQTIGLSGGAAGAPGSGDSTGPHVHYEVRQGGKAVDPTKGAFRTDDMAAAERGLKLQETAAREAAAAVAALDRDYAALGRQLDPTTAALNAFNEQLERIARLQEAGRLDSTEALTLQMEAGAKKQTAELKADRTLIDKIAPDGWEQDFRRELDAAGDQWYNAMDEAGKNGAAQLQAGALDLLGQFGSLMGGKIGKGAGAIQTLVNAPSADQYSQTIEKLLKKLDIFSDKASEKISKAVGQAMEGAAIGSQVAGIVGGNKTGGAIGGALGNIAGSMAAKGITSAVGGALGSALGAAAPVIGSIVGSLAGSVLGKLFMTHKTGSASISDLSSNASLSGNNAGYRQQSNALAGSVQSGISSIADQLGATGIGAFNVSIGMKDGKYRVDPTGGGNVKVKKGALDFGQDQSAAVGAAIADAVADGALQGLSPAVQRALSKYKDDINRGVAEALKVEAVEDLIKGVSGDMDKAFRDFERQAQDRVRIAKEYGFDLVKLEEVNAKQRADMFNKVLEQKLGDLKSLLDDLNFGDLFEGTLADKRTAILGQIGGVRSAALGGDADAANKLATLERSLLGTSRAAYGTAGPEYGADLASAKGDAQSIIDAVTAQAKAAQDAQTAALNANTAQVDLQHETNDLLTVQNGTLNQILAALANGGGGVGGGGFVGSAALTTARFSFLQ